jgi:hypothetical protein
MFDPADCNALCTKAKAMESCINDECDKGTQPASGSWKSDCQKQQSTLDQIFGDLGSIDPALKGIPGCATACDMHCDAIGDWYALIPPID